MKTFNKTRTFLTLILTVLLVASLVGTWVVVSAFTVNTSYSVTWRNQSLTVNSGTTANSPSSYTVKNNESTYIAINGQVYTASSTASSFTVNELRIAALGENYESEDANEYARLLYRKSTESTWKEVNNNAVKSGTTFTATPLVITTAGTYVFCAIWQPDYDDSIRSAYLTITIDPTLGQASAPAKTGKVFTGWYTDSACTIPYTGQVITSDTVLYAGYRPVEFDIVFNAGTGTGTMASEHIVYSGSDVVNMNPTFTKVGYHFSHWVGENGEEYWPDADYDTYYDLYDDGDTITLTAQWEPNTYNVKFNGNGSTDGYMYLQEFTYDVAQNLTTNVFQRAYTVTYNYNGNGSSNTTATATATFNGWATSASGSVVYTDGKSVSNLATSGTFNLYANWTLGKVTLPTPTRTGYTFAGWYTSASGGTKVGAGGASYTPSANITLYAQWTANTYTVSFNGNGGTSPSSITVTYDGTYGTLPTSTSLGDVFLGWYTAASGGTQVTSTTKVDTASDHTLYAHWRAVEFDIIYDGNGATSGTMDSVHIIYSAIYPVDFNVKFDKTGYTFSHWEDEYGNTYYEDMSGDTIISYEIYDDGDEVTFYAQWTANTYAVKFNGNGATSGSMSNQSFTYDVAQNLTTNVFERAYTVTYNYNGNGSSNTTATATATFNGWATSASGSVVYTDGKSVSNLATSGIFNLYANWTFGKVTLPTPTRTGYTFVGWYTSASGGTKVGDAGASYTPSANTTLYAQWTANGYTVVFNANGGSGTMANQGFTYDKAQELSANVFSKTGYHFVGWSESVTATSATYTDEQSVTNIAGTDKTVTLYAVWAANTYTVVFDGYEAGGTTEVTGSTASMSMEYNSSKVVSANGFEREGYTFIGWSTTKGGSVEYMEGDSLKNLTTTNNGTVTLYAVWQINRYSVTFVDSETGETIAVVVVDWGTPTEEVIGQAVNSVLYEPEGDVPNA